MSQQALLLKKRKPGRPKVLDTSIEFRVPWSDLWFVNAVAFYERRDLAELMRGWLNEKRREYRREKWFREWLMRHKDDLRKQGINLEEIF